MLNVTDFSQNQWLQPGYVLPSQLRRVEIGPQWLIPISTKIVTWLQPQNIIIIISTLVAASVVDTRKANKACTRKICYYYIFL